MTQLYKHPILMQCYNVTQKIEACGASPALTDAVIASSALLQDIDKLVDESERRKSVAENIWHSIVAEYGPEGFTKVLRQMEKRKLPYELPSELQLIANLQKCNEELQDLIHNIQDGTQIPDLHEDAMKILKRYSHDT